MYAWIMRRFKQSIKRREPEHEQQVLFFDAVRWMINKHPELSVACHIPNEVKIKYTTPSKIESGWFAQGYARYIHPSRARQIRWAVYRDED
jgi:hypothetical protein